MINKEAGVMSKTTFSCHDKHMAIRVDGDKKNCRFNGLRVDCVDTFLNLCVARQSGNQKNLHVSDKLKSFECENCKCGVEILTGRRKALPANVELIK